MFHMRIKERKEKEAEYKVRSNPNLVNGLPNVLLDYWNCMVRQCETKYEFVKTKKKRRKLIEVVLNDRLGKKVNVKCNEYDTIRDLMKLVYKDHITLKEGDPQRHGSRALLQLDSFLFPSLHFFF